MKVYVLRLSDSDGYATTEGVFSSYSAMVTWLKEKYDYTSDLYYQNEDCGNFLEMLHDGFDEYDVGYNVFDVIGEHSHKTNTVKFD